MAMLSEREVRLLGFLQRRGVGQIRSGEVADWLGLTPQQERLLLSRMASKGIVERVRRGLYLVPSELPIGLQWNPGEARIIETLMADAGARYQISGPAAFVRYGWEDQIPMELVLYNDRLSGRREIGSTRLRLIKVEPRRLGGTVTVETPEGRELVYASKARALLDAVCDWSRFNTLPRALEWIRREVSAEEEFGSELVSMTAKYGNQGTCRRIGYVLEMAGVGDEVLRQLEKKLRRTSSYLALVPRRPKRGRIDKRWMVVNNESIASGGVQQESDREGG